MGSLDEEFCGKLVQTSREIKFHLRVRSRAFEQKTVDKRILSDYDNTDWKIHKHNKKTVVLKKIKSHHVMFEDRVWTILAKMGFTKMNKKGLRLPYVDDESIPGKQIDVFAADKEIIVIVECKSAETMKRQYFSQELNEYDKVIKGGRKTLNNSSFDKHKIKYIFATNNIDLSENDRNRLKELDMVHFNQDDVNYYEQLLNSVGVAAKYQLMARLFKDIDIPAFENKIPAIRGKMGGYYYYSFSIEPEKLLKMAYILHRVNVNADDRGYQRLIKRSRLKEIEEFINNDGYFPNSIIININTKRDGALNFDRIKCPQHDSDITELVILHLPQRYHSAFIIDGQHRLYGYAGSKYKQNNAIPVVAFENLPADEQIELFVKINSKQKPVSKNLLTTIGAELMWNSEKYDEAIFAFMSRLLANLGEKENSPLYRPIILGDKSKTAQTCITLDTVIIHGLKKTSFFAKLNKKKLIQIGHLWCDPKNDDNNIDYSPMLDKSYQFFLTYFNYIKEKTDKIWALGSSPGGFVAMNIGILCFIRIGSDILDFIKKYEGEDFSTMYGKDIAELTFRYLDPIFDYINTFDIQKINSFRKYGANAAGVENGVREFQQIINNQFADFSPDGLSKWILDNSGKYNDVTRLAVEKFEVGIKHKLYEILQSHFGDTWWKDGVPLDIRKNAVNAKLDDESDEPESEFLHLIEYKKVISRNWEICKNVFSDPEVKSNKEAQLKWIDGLNPIRNRVYHNRKVTVEDYEFIKHLNDWLPERLGIIKLNITA